ncbi:MAG: cytochrome c [Candidatus Bipolaricaulota bacterium]|nr:cytochrome c [Candidatus Bipolaricaulota bacterium]
MTRERWGNFVLALCVLMVLGSLAAKGLALLESFSYSESAGAAAPHKPDSPLGKLTLLERGKLVFQGAGCLSCHMARLEPGGPKVGFPVGPSLSNAGMRRDERWLREHYIDPHKLVPGSMMNSFAYLAPEELDALVAYVKSFNLQYEPKNETVNLVIPERFSQEQVERGKALFSSQGCIGCHIVGSAGGPLGPNLTRAGKHGRTDEWQLQHLKNPLSVYVLGPTEGIPWPMPKFDKLSEEDLQALVAYLQSLQ